MKAYTDLEQSKKLAKILPLKSADMYYRPYPNNEDWYNIPNFGEAELKFNQLPCWSLATLLDVLKYPALSQNTSNKWLISEWTGYYPKTEWEFDNPVDACVKMIIKLHEQKLL